MKRMLIKLIIASAALCFAPLINSFAQAPSNPQSARKFDEFGDINFSDLMARLDNLASQLQSEPGTRAFLIIYRSKRDLPGLSDRLASRMKVYLVKTRGIPAERIVTVDGGVATSLVQELWIVPVGAAPKPRDDVYSGQFVDTESAWKFDEYFYPLPLPGEEEYPVGNSLEAFADTLRKFSHAQAYVLAYPQYYRRGGYIDRPGTSQKMLRAVKADLVKKYGIAPVRIKLVNGGYRKRRQIELWIVPRGEHPPIATPNAFPKRRR